MKLFGDFVNGMVSVLTVTSAPQLYRYPYRNSVEAFRGDMMRIGEDIDSVMWKLDGGKKRKKKNGTRRKPDATNN